ncbi:hypothetical protein MMC06_004043 [Schaereria dolodes]|nr:hypothetical protein [Schaereria dolodes]
MSRSLLGKAAGLMAVLLGVAATVFVVIFAVVLTNAHQPAAIVAYVAAGLQTLSLFQLCYISLQKPRDGQDLSMMASEKTKCSHLDLNIVVAAVLSVFAAGTSLAAFVWTKIRLPDLPSLILGSNTWTFLLSAFVIWGLSLPAQLTVYATLPWSRERQGPRDFSVSPPNEQDSHEMVEESRPGTAQTARSNPFQAIPDSTPPASPRSLDTPNSLHSSLPVAIRSSNSKTKLITRPHSVQRDSASISISRPSTSRQSQDSGFDTWDTTEVTPQIRETVLRSSPSTLRSTGLSPIPGSRSPSPAKALEGPFYVPTRPLEDDASSSPQSPLPMTYSRPGSRPDSRPGSRPGLLRRSASNEDHIHPLFRSNSPTPPPTAMPGTTVTAAPYAGLLINERTLSRMRSPSLPSSPLARSDSFDGEGTFPIPSPSERAVTPPMPDSILAVSTRLNVMNHARRKDAENSHEGEAGQENLISPVD